MLQNGNFKFQKPVAHIRKVLWRMKTRQQRTRKCSNFCDESINVFPDFNVVSYLHRIKKKELCHYYTLFRVLQL
jgi:hypothetical protein